VTKGPNTRLADLFALTGWSKGELARLVNKRGAAMGQQQLSTDTSRVRRWMERGETPRDPVPRVLAILFTERLGRVVTIEDLGFQRRQRLPRSGTSGTGSTGPGGAAAGEGASGAPDASGLPPELSWHPDPERTAEALTQFTGMDLMLNRRGVMGASAGLVAGVTIAAPLQDWMAGRGNGMRAAVPGPRFSGSTIEAIDAADTYRTGSVGSDEVEALEHSVAVFRAWDAQRGGGLQRKAVIGQLNEVSGMLTFHHPEHLSRRLWAVAANLAVLAGWMSHDVGMEPTAQHYFVMAVHAARQADDRPRAGEALSRAARQMVHLGRPGDALDLMRVADTRAGDTLPRTRAMLRTVQAWAHAALGQGQATRRTLGEAEDLFTRDTGEPGPDWLQYFNEADLHGMEALTYRTLAEHDERAARLAQYHGQRAIALREGTDYKRSQLFDYLSVASAYYLSNEPEEAGRYAKLALNASRESSSHRTWDRLRQMYRLTGQYQELPEVRELREQIDSAMPNAAAPRPRPI